MTAPVYGLTPSQADCARVIGALTDFEGNSPTLAEIAAELGVTRSNVIELAAQLLDRGWIAPRTPWARRTLKLTRSPPPFDYSAIAITEAGRAYLENAA